MKPFTDTLRDIRRGRVVDAATAEMAEVVRAVMASGKTGTLTLTLSIKPQARADSAVTIQAKLSSKKPSADLPEAIFYADGEGDLHRDDPAQREMFTPTDQFDRETGEVAA